jgi:hypothetical protein
MFALIFEYAAAIGLGLLPGVYGLGVLYYAAL